MMKNLFRLYCSMKMNHLSLSENMGASSSKYTVVNNMETDYGSKIDNWNPETQTVEELEGYFVKLVEQKGLAAEQYIDISLLSVAKEHLMLYKMLNGELYLQSDLSVVLGYSGYWVWAIDFKRNCLLVKQIEDRKIISADELLWKFEKAIEDEYEELPHKDEDIDFPEEIDINEH
jgi:hypothetical protein